MMTRTVRTLALAAFFSTGLVAWSGCNTENPDGTKNALGKAEDKAKDIEHKAVEEAKVVGGKIKEGAKEAGKVVGEKLEEGGKKLQEVSKGEEKPK